MDWRELQATQITATVCMWAAMDSRLWGGFLRVPHFDPSAEFFPYFGHSSVHCLQRFSKP